MTSQRVLVCFVSVKKNTCHKCVLRLTVPCGTPRAIYFHFPECSSSFTWHIQIDGEVLRKTGSKRERERNGGQRVVKESMTELYCETDRTETSE